MKKRRRTFLSGLVCVAAAYWLSASANFLGTGSGDLKGALLHPQFGATKFAEVFLLSFTLCLLAALRSVRPFLRAATFALGFAVFSAALLLGEARIQYHGFLAEGVIEHRFGTASGILLAAAAVGILGLAISWVSCGKGRGTRSRKSPREGSKS